MAKIFNDFFHSQSQIITTNSYLKKKNRDISLLQTVNIWRQYILQQRDERDKQWAEALHWIPFYITIGMAMFFHALMVKSQKIQSVWIFMRWETAEEM